MAASCFLVMEDVPDAPHQPKAEFQFPKRSFGKKSIVHRCFQHCWFAKWPFLHYKETTDVVYCHTCLKMFKEKKTKTSTKADQAFVCRGFSNWKDATIAFKSHELSACHREAVEMIINLPLSTTPVGHYLSKQYKIQVAQNQKMLLNILSSLRFLARQALAIRGHNNDCDGNLMQLLKFQGGGDDEILKWLEKKTNKYQSLSAAEGQIVADMVIRTIKKLRDEDSFDLFWLKVLKMSESLDMEPQLPRQRKRPQRFDDGLADAEFHDDVKASFRQHYFEAIDLIVNFIQDRFQQPGYMLYSRLEQLLLKASEQKDFKEELELVCKFYKEDLHQENLKAQLFTFGIEFQQTRDDHSTQADIFDIKNYFCSLSNAQRTLLSQVCRVLQLVLIMPATNATSERSFSALRRVKNYLRNTMTQQRLNNLMLLHVHRDLTDKLDLNIIANDYVGDSEHRIKIFGTFS